MSAARILVVAAVLLGLVSCADRTDPPPSKAEIARCVELLGHDDFAVREEATARLAEAGEAAEHTLQEAVNSPDAEVARRAKLLLEQLDCITLQGHTDRVLSVAYSPDGKAIASGSWDNMVKVWDADKGSEIFTINRHTDWVHSVAFSPDGKRIASASGFEVKVWRVPKQR